MGSGRLQFKIDEQGERNAAISMWKGKKKGKHRWWNSARAFWNENSAKVARLSVINHVIEYEGCLYPPNVGLFTPACPPAALMPCWGCASATSPQNAAGTTCTSTTETPFTPRWLLSSGERWLFWGGNLQEGDVWKWLGRASARRRGCHQMCSPGTEWWLQ